MKKYSLLLGLFYSLTTFAHPHAFIDMQTTPIVKNNQLQGFSMKWTLDEPSSSAVLYDLKQAVNQDERKNLIDEIMQNVVNEHYFSYLFNANQQKIKYKAHPQNYGINAKGMQLQYYFDLPLAQPQALQNNTFTLQTYDRTYYVAMAYEKNAVDFSPLPSHCQGTLIDPNVDEKMQAYALSLDKNQRDEDDSLGVIFAQKIQIQCE